MNVFRIHGGMPLHGEVPIRGSKNATLAILSAVIMAKGETVLTNFPNIRDVEVKLQLLEKFGVKI